jgi:hemerythrin-like domain-containing protein
MDCIELMNAEHRNIEKALDSLESFGENVAGGGEIDAGRLSDHVAFLRRYADAIHHGKEEAILFAVLRRQGCPEDFGPVIEGICRDHETGRNSVDDLEIAARRQQPWSQEQREALRRTAFGFVTMLRQHIREEDDFVFPRAWELLSAKNRKRVQRACERFEEDHAGERKAMERVLRTLT